MSTSDRGCVWSPAVSSPFIKCRLFVAATSSCCFSIKSSEQDRSPTASLGVVHPPDPVSPGSWDLAFKGGVSGVAMEIQRGTHQ